MLGLFVYVLFLLVLMPLLLFWAGKFAKYCSQRKPDWIGFPVEKPLTPRSTTDEPPPTSAFDA